MCSKCFKDAAAANRARVEAPLPTPVEAPVKVDTVPLPVAPAIPVVTAEPETKTIETPAETEASPPQKKKTR